MPLHEHAPGHPNDRCRLVTGPDTCQLAPLALDDRRQPRHVFAACHKHRLRHGRPLLGTHLWSRVTVGRMPEMRSSYPEGERLPETLAPGADQAGALTDPCIYISDYSISYSRRAGRAAPTAVDYIPNSGTWSDRKETIV